MELSAVRTGLYAGRRKPRARGIGAFMVASLLVMPAVSGAQQMTFEQVVADSRNIDPAVRMGAMRLLAGAGHPDAIRPVAALLQDPVDEIQIEAIATEIRLLTGETMSRRRMVAGVIEVRRGNPGEAAFRSPSLAVPAAPEDVASGLIACMGDASPRVRLEATYAFGALIAPEADLMPPATRQAAADALVRGLGDRDAQMRLASAEVGSRMIEECGPAALPGGPAGSTTFGDAFVHGLNDPDAGVRLASMRALRWLRHHRALQSLTEQFSYYKTGPMAELALGALAGIGHPSSESFFWSLLSHKDSGIRRGALEGLARTCGSSRAGEVEQALAHERSDEVSLAGWFALQKLSGGHQVDRFIQAAARPATRDQARGYLTDLGPAVAPALGAYLQDPQAGVRLAAVAALGRVGSAASIAALQPLSRDPDRTVAAAAARAIRRLGRRNET